MGLFSKSPEAQLVEQYAMGFQASGHSPHEAETMARNMVAQAKQEVAQRGWSNQPPNYGDLLLQQESSNASIHAALEAIRAEGVRDEDIRWWWNMSPLERVMIQKADELNRTAGFIEALKQGLDGEQAAKRVFAFHPKFGDVADGEGDDRPIPIELKRRIVEFTERHYNSPDLMRRKTEQATSFNALIRAEIRAGTL